MTVSEKPWTPEMKLRSSATDEQIKERWLELDRFYDRPHDRGTHPSIAVARELASAVSVEKEILLNDYRANATYLMRQLDEKYAEIARLRRDAERLTKLENLSAGFPVEVDTFLFNGEKHKDNQVFLTIYPATGEEVPDERNVVHPKPVRLGQGADLRAAIDSAKEAQ